MNNESRTLWISVGAGIFAMFLVYSFLQEQKAEIIKPYGGKMNVVVATKDINELHTIDDTMIEVQERPQSFVEPQAVKNPEEIIGYVAVAPIKKGEQILATKLLQPGPETGISLQVQPGRRALAIPINEYTGVARLIRPGDRIDIVAAVDVGKGINQRREVATIMFDVAVLATGINVVNNIPRSVELDKDTGRIMQTALTGDTKYTSLTIEVNAKEAQDLVYLMTSGAGNIYFTLKNPNDRTVSARLPSSTAESVLGRPAVEMSAMPPQPVIQMPTAPIPTGPPVMPRGPQKPRKGFRPL